MSVQTVLLDFTIDSGRITDDQSRLEVKKSIEVGLKDFFPNIQFVYETSTANGYLILFHEHQLVYFHVRLFEHGIITINVEYYKKDSVPQMLTFDKIKNLEKKIQTLLEAERSKHLPPIKRGCRADVYLTSSDERILEYDIDKVLFDGRSSFQKVQIVHSKSLGNMLVLDELQNIAEADLIYTETLMRRGIENYEGKEVCILGGGDGALLYELLKEKPKFVTMLEIDEMVMDACNKYMTSICGDVLQVRKTDNYEIIVDDCMVYLDKYAKEGQKFDYVFGDLTDIPIHDDDTEEIWTFIRSILEKSFKILKPNGKYLTHANGVNCPESLTLFEEQLELLEPKVKFTKSKAFVPSFMEEWVFYQVSFDNGE